jgi:hypothetical protein
MFSYAKAALSTIPKFRHNSPLQLQNYKLKISDQMLKLFPLLHTQAIHLPFFTFRQCIFSEDYFTRRTSGYNLGTLRTVHLRPSFRTKYFVSHYIQGLLFLFFFISRDIALVLAYRCAFSGQKTQQLFVNLLRPKLNEIFCSKVGNYFIFVKKLFRKQH